MGITNQDWKKIELQLTPHRGVKLEADGYTILLSLVQLRATKFAIMVYVNGEHQGRWISEDCEIRRKFIYHKKKYKYPRKIRNKKEKYKGLGIDVNETYFSYSSFFPSFSSVKRHLKQSCEKLEWVN